MAEFINTDWYQEFLQELSGLIIESEFAARWELISCYHKVGSKIIKVQKEKEISITNFVQRVAQNLGKSIRTIRYAVAFAQKYPDLTSAPLEKHISWRGVIKLLEEGTPRKPCEHLETGYYEICKKCGKNLGEEESEY